MRLPKGRFERLLIKIFAWIALALLVVLLVFIAGSTWEVWQKEKGARGELVAAEAALEALQAQRDRARAELDALGSARGAEAVMRERFPVALPGEEVFVLVSGKEVAPLPEREPSFIERVRAWVWGGE